MRRALTLLLLLAGAGLVAAAVVVGAQTASYVARAERATGVVTGVETRRAGGSRSEIALFPVVEFRPAGGGPPRRFRGEGGGARDYRVGDEVDVLYLPDPPRDPRITGLAAVWSRAAGLLFAGVLLGLAGLLGRAMLSERQPDDGAPAAEPDDLALRE